MLSNLAKIRSLGQDIGWKKRIIAALVLFAAGMILGFVSKWADFHLDVLPDITSRMAVWILIGVVISGRSPRPLDAAFFCPAMFIGMVIAYYAAAVMMKGVWGMEYAVGWGIVAVLSGAAGFVCWFAFGRKIVSRVISVGVLLVDIASTILMFDRIRFEDGVCILATACLLFLGRGKKK